MLTMGIIFLAIGVVSTAAALMNIKLVWWNESRTEFVVRSFGMIFIGTLFIVFGLLE